MNRTLPDGEAGGGRAHAKACMGLSRVSMVFMGGRRLERSGQWMPSLKVPSM